MGKFNSRAIYNDIARKYAAQALKSKSAAPILTQSTLMLIQPINVNKSSYNFDPLEFAQQTPEELRLNINDEFTAYAVGVYFKGYVRDAADASRAPILLTADAFEQLAVGQSLKANNLWAGSLEFDVNNKKYIDKLDLYRCNSVRQGRFTEASNTNYDYAEDGMIELSPNISLSGARKNNINIVLPDSLAPFTFAFTGKTQDMTYVIDSIALRFFGLNAQNAAKFQN